MAMRAEPVTSLVQSSTTWASWATASKTVIQGANTEWPTLSSQHLLLQAAGSRSTCRRRLQVQLSCIQESQPAPGLLCYCAPRATSPSPAVPIRSRFSPLKSLCIWEPHCCCFWWWTRCTQEWVWYILFPKASRETCWYKHCSSRRGFCTHIGDLLKQQGTQTPGHRPETTTTPHGSHEQKCVWCCWAIAPGLAQCVKFKTNT